MESSTPVALSAQRSSRDEVLRVRNSNTPDVFAAFDNRLRAKWFLSTCAVLGGILAANALPASARAAASEIQTVQPVSGTNTNTRAPASTVRYRPSTSTEIARNRQQAIVWAEIARRTIVPTMHLVETGHFLIFSAWNVSNDLALANVCEEMYAKLSQQLNVGVAEPFWAGKLPVYVFWKTRDYVRFAAEVDKASSRRNDIFHAAGYHSSRGSFAYIVLSGAEDFGRTRDGAIQRFYEVLAHEGTHAFMNRYLTNRSIPVWVEEGFADYMAATLVPRSDANLNFARSAQRALRQGGNVSEILDKKTLNHSEYGVCQSLIRFMIRSNPQSFYRFVSLLKLGRSEADALRESYRANRVDLLRHWAYSIR